jgi:hypothetical protein
MGGLVVTTDEVTWLREVERKMTPGPLRVNAADAPNLWLEQFRGPERFVVADFKDDCVHNVEGNAAGFAHLRNLAPSMLAVIEAAAGMSTVCRECRDEAPVFAKDVTAADFVLWGKLFPPEALGPRCYTHTAKYIGHVNMSRVDQYAIVDLRPLRDALDAFRAAVKPDIFEATCAPVAGEE